MSKLGIAVLLSGRGSNFRAIYEAIDSGVITKAEIVCVISDKQNAAGLEFAKEKGIKTYFLNSSLYPTREDYDAEIVRVLKGLNVRLVCLAGYMRIVTPVLIGAYRGHIMNIHPALLPSFPGLHAQRQALHHGVKVSGCTVHFVDEGVDTGPIILQQSVPVLSGDTEETLSARILVEEHKLYPQAVALFTAGRLSISGRLVSVKA